MKTLTQILFFCYLFSLNFITYSQNGNSINNKTINFVYSEKLFPKVELREAKVSIDLWTKEIVSDMKKPYSFNNLFIKNIRSVDNSFIEQDIDFVTMSALEYLINYERLRSLNPIIVSTVNDIIGVEYLLLVHKGNNFNSIRDLENQTIAFVDDYSNDIAQVWLDVLLNTNKLPLSEEFYKNIEVSKNANHAILKTFFKQVDACLVPKSLYESSIELNPQIDKNLIILKQSEPFIVGVLCSHNKIDEDLRIDVVQSAKKVLGSAKGKQFAIFFRTAELIDFKSEHIDNLKNLVNSAKKYNIKLNR